MTRQPSIEVQCEHCHGKGIVPLSDALAQVLEQVKRHRTTAETIQPAIADRVVITAINNRLERLRRLGLVTRHREGKYYHYLAV